MLAFSTTRLAEPQADSRPAPDPLAVFTARCEARALLWQAGEFDLHEAVDKLQADAVRDGLVAKLGQDAVQAIMAKAFAAVRDDEGTQGHHVPVLPDPLLEGLKICADTKRHFEEWERRKRETDGFPTAGKPSRPKGGRASPDPLPDDEYDGLPSTFAKACREADEKQHRKPVDPRIAKARRRLADDVSFERAWHELNRPTRVAASTLMAAEHLVREGDAGRLRNWLGRHSAKDRAAIQKYIGEAKHAAKPRRD
jgi:hypothetical protein